MPESAKRPRVLIVEDFPLIQESIRQVLQPDCEVLGAAENSEIALAEVSKLRPDIVVLDVSLPDSSGFALAEKLNQTQLKPNVVFVTAYLDKMYVERAFEIGAKGYVLKSRIHTELPAAIREVTGGGRYLSPLIRAKLNLNIP